MVSFFGKASTRNLSCCSLCENSLLEPLLLLSFVSTLLGGLFSTAVEDVDDDAVLGVSPLSESEESGIVLILRNTSVVFVYAS